MISQKNDAIMENQAKRFCKIARQESMDILKFQNGFV
jgi:hypothetical protein